MKSGIKHLNEWLIVIVIVVGVSFAGIYLFGIGINNNPLHFFNPYPGSIILGLDTVAAIDIFGGEVPEQIGIDYDTLSILMSVLFLLIMGPWLLYKGYMNQEKRDSSKFMPWYWFVGAGLNVLAISSIPVLIISFQVHQNTKSGIEVNRIQDAMRQELQDVGFAAAEYAILEGGFEESFSVAELDMSELEFEYRIEGTPSDSSVVIISQNLDSEDGRNKVEVMPYSPKVMSFRN